MSKILTRLFWASIFCALITACAATSTPTENVPLATVPPEFVPSAPNAQIPQFKYIAIMVFENATYESIIGNPEFPETNRLASENVLLTNYHGVAHPSLPNYIAMISGDTYGFEHNCDDCAVNVLSLPDYIEATGRVWSTYQEDMPDRCYTGDISGLLFKQDYVQKHNPFLFFSPIRDAHERCEDNVLPLTFLDEDVRDNTLPNYIFVVPNTCHDGHDCAPAEVDAWLGEQSRTLISILDATAEPYLLVITWDEDEEAGAAQSENGRIATLLISPQAKPAFQDDTFYDHYSLLKTVSAVWGLPYLGHAADEATALIINPWK